MNRTPVTTGVRQDCRDEVLGLLGEQCALCRRLKGLGARQRMLIEADQAQDLLEVLANRQQIIDRLGALSERMRPYQQSWAEIRSRLGDEDGRRADELLSDLNAHLAGILEGDRADAELLASRRQETGADMGRLKSTRMAGAAYAASQQGPQVSHVEWTDE